MKNWDSANQKEYFQEQIVKTMLWIMSKRLYMSPKVFKNFQNWIKNSIIQFLSKSKNNAPSVVKDSINLINF